MTRDRYVCSACGRYVGAGDPHADCPERLRCQALLDKLLTEGRLPTYAAMLERAEERRRMAGE